MRRNPTEPEKRLWRHLSNSQLNGLKFRRQAVIGHRIVDFFCPAISLAIEVDGDTHDRVADERRDAGFPFPVLRITNHDVMTNMAGVLEAIISTASALPPRWPHPNPSPEGEGLEVMP